MRLTQCACGSSTFAAVVENCPGQRIRHGLFMATRAAWRGKRNVPRKPSPLPLGGLIFVIGETGAASSVNEKSGEAIWQQRAGGEYFAAPVASRGLDWLFGENGRAIALQPGRAQ
jgi:hypothetical protein